VVPWSCAAPRRPARRRLKCGIDVRAEDYGAGGQDKYADRDGEAASGVVMDGCQCPAARDGTGRSPSARAGVVLGFGAGLASHLLPTVALGVGLAVLKVRRRTLLARILGEQLDQVVAAEFMKLGRENVKSASLVEPLPDGARLLPLRESSPLMLRNVDKVSELGPAPAESPAELQFGATRVGMPAVHVSTVAQQTRRSRAQRPQPGETTTAAPTDVMTRLTPGSRWPRGMRPSS
jgi:hypothetical protein